MNRTPLHASHLDLGARMVDFAGWEMPIHYGSQIDEHHAVRTACGMFDVAHMAAVDLRGERTREFLSRLLANDVAKLKTPGKALYSCMLNADGGVIDDLIVYHMSEQWFRLVVNAGTSAKDLNWIRQQADGFDVEVSHRDDLGILAVQGPSAPEHVRAVLDEPLRTAAADLKPFNAVDDQGAFVSRTGYTGENGYELILPHDALVATWAALRERGVTACGLGARDTLRLEAGMNLYGQDMDEAVSPLECGLSWTVSFKNPDRDFIGRGAIEPTREQPPRRQLGLVLDGRGVLRAHQPVRVGGTVCGETTSGGFSPTMKASIGLARVDADAVGDCEVEIRGKWVPARLAGPPFVRNGEVLV